MKDIGLYIHVPFCKSKCPYCGFYSVRSDACGFDSYTVCALESMEQWADRLNRKADTLYFGGGTPSLIGGQNIALLTRRARELFGVSGEITVECNPSSADGSFFETIAAAGVNRISLGMQSFVDSERRALGRTAGSEKVESCIQAARAAGINNISLDIMLGIPRQTEENLKRTVEFCIESGVPHISAYMLSLEPDTYFYKNAHKLNLPDDDFTADLYLTLSEALRGAGFEHYEISNFAKPGFEGRHNTKYWNCDEYLGIGPSAHSFINGRRFYYPADAVLFEQSGEAVDDGSGGDPSEYLMLRLRLKEGLNFSRYFNRFGKELPKPLIEEAFKLEKYGYTKVTPNGISLTVKGFLVSNAIIARLESHLKF